MSAIDKMIENAVQDVGVGDFVMIVRDGCYQLVSYEDFIKNITLGGTSICEAVMRCWDSMGDFEEVEYENEPPTFEDIYLAINNRETQDFTEAMFLSKYSDPEGDELGYIIVTGGDLAGYTFKGEPLNLGQLIAREELSELKYTAKDVENSYRQGIMIDVYDVNNVKAL